MKLKNLFLSLGLVCSAAVAVVVVNTNSQRASFAPRNIQAEGYNESVDILKKLRGNLMTGNFEVADVVGMFDSLRCVYNAELTSDAFGV